MYAACAATRFFTRRSSELRFDSSVADGSSVPLDVPRHGAIGTARGQGTLIRPSERGPCGSGIPVCGPMAARDGRPLPDLYAGILCGCVDRMAVGNETKCCSDGGGKRAP